jgi:hypothetical protein
MRFVVDENVSMYVVERLKELGHIAFSLSDMEIYDRKKKLNWLLGLFRTTTFQL